MDFFDSNDCIIACSSGGDINTAIAIIRISGFSSLELFEDVFSISPSLIKNRFAHYCKILDGKDVIDEIVLTFFKGPKSFNGENILELSVHGNAINVQNIISLLCKKLNIRRAYPGEFSYRAYRNKKLSLSQVEGLDLFLNANNPLSLKQGMSLLNGSLQEAYLELLSSYKMHRSAIELSIDFMDDVGEEEGNRQIQVTLDKLKDSISVLKDRIISGKGNLIEPEIVLIGEPNAGKSSLFNSLLKNHRAIVSNIAGTTRDYISEEIFFKSSRFKLIDTAGVRETSDVIETAGIEKTWKIAKNAFFKILVINPFESSSDLTEVFKDNFFDLILFTNADQEGFIENSSKIFKELKILGPIEPIFLNGPIEPIFLNGPIEPKTSIAKGDVGPIEPVITCGPIGANLKNTNSKLNLFILDRIYLKYTEISNKEPILLERHVDQINNVYNLLSEYEKTLNKSTDISIISSEFNIVGHCISELVGIISPDDILENIFQNFCIGK